MSIISIGYSRRSVEQFITILQKNNIRYLIDVRTKPYSKYSPDFNKENLTSTLKNAGITYVFMGDTVGGLPSDNSCYTDGKVDYKKTALSNAFQSGVQRLVKANKLDVNVAIMCSEMKPEQCHRSKLIGEALRTVKIDITHIDEVGLIQSQNEVINRITKGQFSMFEDEFTSVKKYR